MDGVAVSAEHTDAAIAALRTEITDDTLDLPLLPNVAAEVVASSVDDRADARHLAELIQQDQSLAGHVLRVVNSPAFRGAAEIVALQQAIARLGMSRIREIALSASLKATLFRAGPYDQRASAVWRRSLAAGLWAREVARAARSNVEVAYLCGLLHDIGAPVLLHRLGELYPALDDDGVEQVLDVLAVEVGGRLAAAWALPAAVQAAIAADVDATPYADAVAITACAVALADSLAEGAVAADAVAARGPFSALNLYPEDLEALLAQQEAIRLATESMLL